MFCKNHVLKNFANFTAKHRVRPRDCNFFKKKKESRTGEFCGIFNNTFFYRKPPVVGSDGLAKSIKTDRSSYLGKV